MNCKNNYDYLYQVLMYIYIHNSIVVKLLSKIITINIFLVFLSIEYS